VNLSLWRTVSNLKSRPGTFAYPFLALLIRRGQEQFRRTIMSLF
jgi:hypothetical protein